MKCPHCSVEVGPADMIVEESAEEDGIEVSFGCPGCHKDFFVVLQSEVFEEVD
jgi:transposase-like protein